MSAVPSTTGGSSRYTAPSIAGDYCELTARQKELLAIASELGRTRFAPPCIPNPRRNFEC